MLQVREGSRRLLITTMVATVAMVGAAQAQVKDTRDDNDRTLWQETLAAAKEGSASAQCDLGELIVRGKEAQRGMKVAAKWFGEAAKQDALCGLMRMGEFHRRGTGVDKNLAQSDSFYARALPQVAILARSGDIEMQIQLAKMHHKALGTEEDLELAAVWYRNAAASLEPLVKVGDIDAHKKLANILIIGIGIDRDVVRAGKLYEVAAIAGDRAGLYLAGTMWFTGRANHPVDHVRGFKWLYKAAEINHPRSQGYVGAAYAKGLGVEADPVLAVKWLQLAIDRGVGAARPEMKELEQEITEKQLKQGKALAAEWIPLFDRPENKTS
ncbi:MAG: tetratricopeptide repeat protein [Minwuia sp.]|nr:tetratricopeptide repeat protein [Minwuia sp.]